MRAKRILSFSKLTAPAREHAVALTKAWQIGRERAFGERRPLDWAETVAPAMAYYCDPAGMPIFANEAYSRIEASISNLKSEISNSRRAA